jgi:hypothetical protein
VLFYGKVQAIVEAFRRGEKRVESKAGDLPAARRTEPAHPGGLIDFPFCPDYRKLAR